MSLFPQTFTATTTVSNSSALVLSFFILFPVVEMFPSHHVFPHCLWDLHLPNLWKSPQVLQRAWYKYPPWPHTNSYETKLPHQTLLPSSSPQPYRAIPPASYAFRYPLPWHLHCQEFSVKADTYEVHPCAWAHCLTLCLHCSHRDNDLP